MLTKKQGVNMTKKNSISDEDRKTFDETLDSYMKENFFTRESNEVEKVEYSRADALMLIETIIMQGHIDIIEKALAEEELGVDDSDPEHMKFVEILKNNYPIR
jgi:hypothetical protein